MSELSQQIARDNLSAYGTSELISACKSLAAELNRVQPAGSYVNIHIDTDNDGLRDGASIADIVRSAAARIEAAEYEPGIQSSLRDINGNTCGYVECVVDEEEE